MKTLAAKRKKLSIPNSIPRGTLQSFLGVGG